MSFLLFRDFKINNLSVYFTMRICGGDGGENMVVVVVVMKLWLWWFCEFMAVW